MNRRLLSLGLVVAGLVAGILSLPWTASANAPGSEATNVLESLTRYSKMRSIHFIAQATIWLAPHDDQPAVRGTGEFEYWASADRYSVRCVTSRQLGLAADLEIAFDGDHWQQFERASGVLSVRKGDNHSMPLALPNPLFLPLEFLSPATDTCQICAIRLTDLQDPRFWSRRTQTAHRIKSPSSDAKSLEYTYTLDGAVLRGAQLSYRIDLGTVQRTVVPLKVTRLSSDGSRQEVSASNFEVPSRRPAGAILSAPSPGRPPGNNDPRSIAEAEIDSREGGIGPIPSRLVMLGYDTTGKNVSNVTFTIDVIDLNWNAQADVFTIDQNQAKVVWDSDARVFTKHYNPAVMNRKLPEICATPTIPVPR